MERIHAYGDCPGFELGTAYDELLLKRPERRATLLVEGDNDTARCAYEKWGWRQIGKIRSGWPDAPHYDALILDLS